MGADDSGSDAQANNRALVKALNERGGLAGRKINPVFYTIDGSAADATTQEQAACAAFTQDNRVEVSLGGGVGETFFACMLKARVPFVSSDPSVGLDTEALSRFPNGFNPPGLNTDRQARAYMETSLSTGWLSNTNKLGVLLSGCPWGPRTYEKIVLSLAKQRGIPTQFYDLGCPRPGVAAVSEGANAVSNAVLRFRSEGVDRVLFLAGTGDASNYVLFTNNAESQGYHPGYIAGSGTLAAAWHAAGVTSEAQAANTCGAGWLPVVDLTERLQSAQAKICDDLARKGGAPEQEQPAGLRLSCDSFLLLDAALKRSGGSGTLSALRPAIEGLDASAFVSAITTGGATSFGPTKHDGATQVRSYAFESSCRCFRHNAPASAVR